MDLKFDTAKSFMSQLASEAVDYIKLRKNQAKSMARLRATTITQSLLFPFIETHASDIDALYLKDQLSVDWLTNVMINVQPDSEKVAEAVSFVKSASKEKINKSATDELITQLIVYMKEDFNSMRSLKQSIYYRSRSINAIMAHFASTPDSFKMKKISSQYTLKSFLNELKEDYFNSGKAPKHTQNSYMNEFLSFIHDMAPTLINLDEFSATKSLDNKFTQNLTNFADLADKDSQIESAYKDLMKLLPYSEGISNIEDGLATTVSKVDSTPALSVSLKKGVGVTFIYSHPQLNEQSLNQIADRLLLAIMEAGDFPDLDIHVNKTSRIELVVSCDESAKPNEILKVRRLLEKTIEDK